MDVYNRAVSAGGGRCDRAGEGIQFSSLGGKWREGAGRLPGGGGILPET